MRSQKKEYQKWQEWIEIIYFDLQEQSKFQRMFKHYIQKYDELTAFVSKCYFIQTAMAIRRQLGTQKDEISLMKLLQQLHKAQSMFYLHNIPTNDIQDDIQKLIEIENRIGLYVDRKIAHLDRRKFDQACTLEDLNYSLKILNTIVAKYFKCLTH